jgi:hypothetical protein
VTASHTDLNLRVTHLPLGEVLEGTYKLSSKSLDVTTAGLQLYFRHESHIYIVTISSHSHSLILRY